MKFETEIKDKNTNKVVAAKPQQKVESNESSSQSSSHDEPQEPQSSDETLKAPAKSKVTKFFQKVSTWPAEKKADEASSSSSVETIPDKKDTTKPQKFKAWYYLPSEYPGHFIFERGDSTKSLAIPDLVHRVKFYQSVQKKSANTWITTTLENDKFWKEKGSDQVQIEVDTTKSEIILKGSKLQNPPKSTPSMSPFPCNPTLS